MHHRLETYGSRRCAYRSGTLRGPPRISAFLALIERDVVLHARSEAVCAQLFIMLGPHITTVDVPQQEQLGFAVILVQDDRCWSGR